TFKIVLSNPTDATLSVSTNTVTITDDDVSTIGFTTSAVTVSETNGTLTLTVVRAGATNTAVSVNFATTNGTAAAGNDYTATNGTFSFAAGETTNTLSIDILDNLNQEGTETFQVRLSNASNTSMGVGTNTVTITDDDGSTVGVAVSALSVAENTNSVTLYVLRTGTTNTAVSVNFATPTNGAGTTNNAVTVDFTTTNFTATAGTDYTATNGTLSFAAGQTSKTFTVDILDDNTQESSETFKIVLSNPTDATLGVATNTVTITDDDGSIVGFAVSALSLAENTNSISITVVRSGSTNTAVSVNFTNLASSTATAGSDFVATNGILSFAAGVTTNTFAVRILNDTAPENNEFVNLRLQNPTNCS